jgi:hypothetical protein
MDINAKAKAFAKDKPQATLEEAFIAGFVAHADFVESANKKKEEVIKKKKSEFAETLKPYLSIYGKEMLNEFYAYWTEPIKSNTPKIRYDGEKFWDLARRLNTWKARNNNATPAKNNPSGGKTMEVI